MDPAFWANQERARTVVQEIKQLKSWVTPCADITARLADATDMAELLEAEPDEAMAAELEAECGIVAARCTYEVEAIAADERRAALLGVVPGSPLLVTHEVLFDQGDAPVSLGSTAYRGDAFRFRATLFRS